MSRAEHSMIELDVHTHLAPINPGRLAGMPGVSWLPDEGALLLDGHRVGMRDLFHPERLLGWMDENQVRRALVSIPPPLYRQALPAPQALAWVRYVNEEMLAITQASDGRLSTLFYLPLEHPELIETLLADYRAGPYEGMALAAGGHPDIDYSQGRYAALWQCLDEKKAFVFIHPGTCADPRLARFYLENLVGNPYETGVAASHLVMAGVPARYPGIRFCLAHAGGVFSALCGRMQQGFDTSRPGVDLEQEVPLQAALRFRVDCIAHHPGVLRLARDVFGADNILFGSDWPFPMGIRDAVANYTSLLKDTDGD